MTTGTSIVATDSRRLAAIEGMLATDPRLQSAHTRRGYRRALADFDAWRGDRPITRLTVEAYAAALQGDGRAPATINHTLAAIRWYARRMTDAVLEIPNLDPAQRDEMTKQSTRAASVAGLRGNSAQKGRHVAEDEIVRLLIACENDPTVAGVRDGAMIAVCRQAGLRRSELAGLTMGAMKQEEEGVTLRILGKGAKVREVFLFDGAADALADWLVVRGPGADAAPVFCAIRRGGHIDPTGEPLSGQALQDVLSKRAAQAKVVGLTWHDLRRTLAGDLLDRGADLVTVQRQLGHASPTTTANYDRRGRRTRQNAIRGVVVPYTRRTLPIAA